jgi:hypothetical protein
MTTGLLLLFVLLLDACESIRQLDDGVLQGAVVIDDRRNH